MGGKETQVLVPVGQRVHKRYVMLRGKELKLYCIARLTLRVHKWLFRRKGLQRRQIRYAKREGGTSCVSVGTLGMIHKRDMLGGIGTQDKISLGRRGDKRKMLGGKETQLSLVSREGCIWSLVRGNDTQVIVRLGHSIGRVHNRDL